ncbi:hypothetical protein [Actinoplanes sp. ATCC 53533]|uniref:hypothetical protein n=1 Tax=Actinoplanes sp. ATCC 53533 TaxID=1288362 RepID=UPI001F4878E2|nr:hypothetical protein [Actinoplanes sp. ATCC 53533]
MVAVAVAGVGQRLVASRVSRWERAQERPSDAYLDALCQVYNTGPVDLGFGADYGDNRAAGNPSSHDPAAATTDGHGEPWLRHDPAIGRSGIVSGLGAAARRADLVRRRMDEALSASTLSDSPVAYKESVAAQYGRTYKTQPASVFLDNILEDLEDVQVLTDRKLPAGQRRDLCAVTARLARLVSMAMVNLGHYRQARDWVHTARLAADEACDPALRAWVATRGAVACLNLGDPQAAVTAARDAELLTRHHPQPITAMVWAILARAAACMAQPDAARHALRRAESLFGTVDNVTENSAYAFTAGQLHFYRSHALTTLGESRAAWQAQDDAIAAFGPGERLDPTPGPARPSPVHSPRRRHHPRRRLRQHRPATTARRLPSGHRAAPRPIDRRRHPHRMPQHTDGQGPARSPRHQRRPYPLTGRDHDDHIGTGHPRLPRR